MIGYRNAETVLNENPSKTLAFEIIKMGRVWILEELLERLDDELDIETKRQVKIFLKKSQMELFPFPIGIIMLTWGNICLFLKR